MQTAEEHAEQVAGLVGDLRRTAARYPADTSLRRLVAELGSVSPRFVELWQAPPDPAPAERSRQKVIQHPDVGRITLERATLVVAGDDLRIMAYTAEPATTDAERLELATVPGTRSLLEQDHRVHDPGTTNSRPPRRS